MKKPTLKSRSKYFELSTLEGRTEYIFLLDKISNNPHKYTVISDSVKAGFQGDAAALIHYSEDPNEEDRKKNLVSFFCEQLIIPHDLEKYDSLIEASWKKEVQITWVKEFRHKEKELEYDYYLVFCCKMSTKQTMKNIKPEPRRSKQIIDKTPTPSIPTGEK